MNGKTIFIYSNESESSVATEEILRQKLDQSGFSILPEFSDEADYLISIGGDGTFLQAIHKYGFPTTPFIGINTGHLGFFQEIMPDQLDDLIFNISQQNYKLQQMSTVRIQIVAGGRVYEHIGLNEVAIKGPDTYSIHLNISIGGSFIERFSGDGLLIATPAGSTAYNYSLGGSIVDPRLNLLQVTPIAPMNTTAYRSFTSSILLPAELSLGIIPDMGKGTETHIVYDGNITRYENVESMDVSISDIKVNLVRFQSYDFWTKVKSKFL